MTLAQDDPYEMRLHPVDLLIKPIRDYVGRPVGLNQDWTGGSIMSGEEEWTRIGEEELPALVKRLVARKTWEDRAAWIGLDVEGLRVMQRRSVHLRIARFLEFLRRSLFRPITINAEIVDVDPALLRRIRPKGNAILTPAQVAAIRKATRESRRAKAVAAARFSAIPGQRVHSWTGRQHAYLADHDVQIATASVALDPIVDAVNEGTSFQLRVFPAPVGDAVGMEIVADTIKLLSDRGARDLSRRPRAGRIANRHHRIVRSLDRRRDPRRSIHLGREVRRPPLAGNRGAGRATPGGRRGHRPPPAAQPRLPPSRGALRPGL